MDHHLGGGGVVELKDILNELPLLLLDFAGFFAHVHHLADIRLADPLLESLNTGDEVDDTANGKGQKNRKGNE